jgi:error-prone DNA polymerase
MGFVHLHVHSHYSFLDGADTIDRLLHRAKELGMPAMTLTDHNRLTGAVRFYDKAKALGIKPIIGAEVDLDVGYHLTLLCKDRTGYSSLCRLLTEAHLSQPGKQPRATREMLCKYPAGLIALSGCSRGEIPSLLSEGKFEKARMAACFYRELFGDEFFIELIRYPSKYGNQLVHSLAAFAAQQNIPVVATNNVHYAERQDYQIKELLNAIGQNIPVSQLGGHRTMEQYFKSQKEMAKLFQDFPQAIEMTTEIADRCNLDLGLGTLHFPSYDVPQGETSYSYLRKLAYAGTNRKYSPPAQDILNRLERELETIEHLGFSGYFLVVWDIVRWAKERGISCQARGSAADSLVVFVLDISTVDPIHYNLLFERFMHPLRREPPDIDLDIDRRRRDEVRDYVYQKYGSDNVCCVSTINTYLARGAIRDVGKALQLPQAAIEDACNGIHYLSASELMDKAKALPELKGCSIYKDSALKDFFRLCNDIDGFPKHLSVHLGGLVIGDGKLSEFTPLERSAGGDIISQYDKDDVEKLGLVKMDLLALPTITVIEDAISHIKAGHGLDINIDAIPRDDPEPFAMLRDGKTIGVFQLESPAQREMAGRLLPHYFEDIIVSISLVRPGPLKSSMDKSYLARRHGNEEVTYLHPKLKSALEETLGVILYQEQVLKVAHDLAGMSYAEADGFRRAMTHDRTAEEMEGMRGSFISSALKNGVSQDIASKVFEQLAAFAAYGFCKAHAVAYAELSYKTLWLKCHYPAEFFAALLSNQPMGYYPSRVLVADARRFGINIMPPDINKSLGCYTVENGAIIVGLSQLKGIATEEIESIVTAREQGIFTSLRDLVQRTNISRPILEKLIKVGACDMLGRRAQMLPELPGLLPSKGLVNHGAVLLLEEEQSLPPVYKEQSIDGKKQMLVERDLLSLDLSAHPLDFYDLSDGFTRIKELPSLATGQAVKITGSVIRYQTPPTRNGKRVVYVIMEDGTGVADVTLFSDVQEKCGQVLFRTGWLIIEGKIQRRGPKSLTIIAQKLYPLTAKSHTVQE